MSKEFRKFLHNPELDFIDNSINGNSVLNDTFIDENGVEKISFSKVFKWIISPKPNRKAKKIENYSIPVVKSDNFLTGNKDGIVWLGHASFLIRISGITILTDPCLRSLPFLKRKTELPFSIHKIRNLDYILVSHGHRDHFDIPTVKQILKHNPDLKFLVPLRFGKLLQRNGIQNFQEAGWFQRFKINEPEVIFLPAKHWHRRGINDMNKILWGSFLLRTPEKTIYFGGDSGYGKHYKSIRNLIDGQIDDVILPIGAYEPSYIMKSNHMNPGEAVTAFHDLKGKRLIPMHYGTYDLSDEPMGDPEKRIRKLDQEGKIRGELKICSIGENIVN